MTSAKPASVLPLLRREALWLITGLALGFAALPVIVYQLGNRTLGPYEGAGAGALAASLYGDFARLRPTAWILLLGPLAVIYALRLCGRVFRGR